MLRMTKNLLMEMLERQEFRCAISGRDLTPETASIDHIMPLARGGAHCPTNAQIVHVDINQAKRNMTNEEFVQMCCEVAEVAQGDGVGGLRAAN